MTQKEKFDEMMALAEECETKSMADMQVSTMCCIAENTAMIADALRSRQQDSDAVYLANRICEIAKKYTDADMAMTEIAYRLEFVLGKNLGSDFKQYFKNCRIKGLL